MMSMTAEETSNGTLSDSDSNNNNNNNNNSTTVRTNQCHLPPHHSPLPRGDEYLDNNNNKRVTNNDSAIAKAFSNDGFVILNQALDPNVLHSWKIYASTYFQEVFKILHKNGHTRVSTHVVSATSRDHNNDDDDKCYALGHGAKNGFKEIVMRSPGRYELSLLGKVVDNGNYTPADTPELQSLIRPLENLLPMLLLDNSDCKPCVYNTNKNERNIRLSDMKLCHLSLLTATPGSSDQAWHSDGGHINLSKHSPCHCYNVFIPLQDVSFKMGPTEFRPGSHYLTRNLGPMMLAAKCRKTLRQPVCPTLKLGDVAIFDYRILHRGRANATNNYRDILVLTFCQPWFEDILNFPKRSMMDPAAGVTAPTMRSTEVSVAGADEEEAAGERSE